MITVARIAFLLLQTAATLPARPAIPVQLGVSLSQDTVTVGQRFVAVLRVRAPRGATIEFPSTVDSASANSSTGMELIGKPAIATMPDSASLTMSAAYRLAAWDVGLQRIALTDIVVRHNGQTGYISLADRGVFVKSVLPADSALRVPKPARPAMVLTGFNWGPLLVALLILAALLAIWRIWIWYRRKRDAPLDPFEEAQRQFARIDQLRLVEAGEGEQHATLMSDVMREYLARRIPEIERSHTSSEIVAASGRIHAAAPGLGELLWRTDLIKFARSGLAPGEPESLGATARSIVQKVEDYVVAEEEREGSEAKAA